MNSHNLKTKIQYWYKHQDCLFLISKNFKKKKIIKRANQKRGPPGYSFIYQLLIVRVQKIDSDECLKG